MRLQSNLKPPRHRASVPDAMRKAVIALKMYQDLSWVQIERKTGVGAKTANYICRQAVKRAGGEGDPVRLLDASGARPEGPVKGRTDQSCMAFITSCRVSWNDSSRGASSCSSELIVGEEKRSGYERG